MYDFYKITQHLEKELDKKAESGLRNTTDLETVAKILDAMKDIAKTEYYCSVTEAMEQEGYSHDGGYSESRRRDSRGRYSRADGGNGYEGGSSYRTRGYSQGGYSEAKGEYMDAKHSYRSSGSPESKREMDVTLRECMTKLKEELDEMEANADTREEREKIRDMRRDIAKLA